MNAMYNVASTGSSETQQFDTDVKKELFSGFDSLSYPYAQLTQVGSEQLTQVGAQLRKRYIDSGLLLSPETKLDSAASSVYLRSTNICRTLQSLRSLLVGFFGTDEKIPHDKLPVINTVPKRKEVLFPQGDGPCKPFSDRRQELMSKTPMTSLKDGLDKCKEDLKKKGVNF